MNDEVDPMVSVMKVDKAPLESYADIGTGTLSLYRDERTGGLVVEDSLSRSVERPERRGAV
jgi:ATP-dependent 26S proteasome regulatory subunit